MKERRKEEQEWKEKFAKLEQRYDLLANASQSSEKGKTILADNLFQNTSSPFVERIITYHLLDKFKLPDIPVYSRLADPVEHLENFRARFDLGTPDEIACKAFPLTLAGIARKWFKKLSPASVVNFKGLGRMFLSQFMAGIVKKKPAESLMTVKVAYENRCEVT